MEGKGGRRSLRVKMLVMYTIVYCLWSIVCVRARSADALPCHCCDSEWYEQRACCVLRRTRHVVL